MFQVTDLELLSQGCNIYNKWILLIYIIYVKMMEFLYIQEKLKILLTKNKIGKANSKPKPLGFGEKLSKIKTGISLPLGTGDKIGKTKEKPVIQFNKEGNIINNFDSAKKAAEYIGVHEVNMRLHLGGKYKTCKKFIFKYKCNGN